MAVTIVRSRSMLTHAIDRATWQEVPDGAVLVEGSTILETGTYDDFSRRFPSAPVLGSANDILVPGFVNAHHHSGVTPIQLGSPDMPLELWFATRMVSRNVDTYLDTLFSAFEMIASGITTVQHIDGGLSGRLPDFEVHAAEVLRAYRDIGMRVSYCFSVRDQNRLVYQADADFVASLPVELRGPTAEWFARSQLVLEDQLDLFKSLLTREMASERTRIQLAPANLHWCSDKALEALAKTSDDHDALMHVHLVETQYQKEYARRRGGGGTALEYLDTFGLINSRLTIGHGVWLSDRDIDRVAESGTCLCHNCSSNFRLRSGVAPLNRFESRGITTAIGLDEAGINDDRDMLQEMRMVLLTHRVPGMDEAEVPGTGQVLRMATADGARTTPFGDRIGRLEAGSAADLLLIDWRQPSYPFLDEETSTLDAILHRGKSEAVNLVMCAGEVIYRDGVFTRVDRDAALRALHDQLASALSADEVQRRKLSKALLPYVRNFYANYISENSAPLADRGTH